MRASAIEFRFRMVINAVVIILGFWAPWIEAWGVGKRITLIEWLALQLSRLGVASFSVSTVALITLAFLFAAFAATFRVSGTAYLGPTTVNSVNLIAGNVMASGPYRFVRNPLYIGLWCMVTAMIFLMPATGAVFSLVLITLFMIRLTLGEEAFLTAQLGQPYLTYLQAVPRFIPRLRGAPARSAAKPHWLRALLAELTPIGVLVGILVFSRNYDLALSGRVILIFFGASLIARALVPGVLINSKPAK
jgi:protein-S-isoprenylcysteine O-methyltransferase Ste14